MSFNNETLFFHACVLKILLWLTTLPQCLRLFCGAATAGLFVGNDLLQVLEFFWSADVNRWPQVSVFMSCGPCWVPGVSWYLGWDNSQVRAHRWDNKKWCDFSLSSGWVQDPPLVSAVPHSRGIIPGFFVLLLQPVCCWDCQDSWFPVLLLLAGHRPHAGSSEQPPLSSGHGTEVKRTEHCSAVTFSSFS